MNLKQKELWDWQIKNFGAPKDSFPLEMAIGMGEELGEAYHTLLKGIQKIREGVNGVDTVQLTDDIFDVWIYSLQLLSYFNVDAEEGFKETVETVLNRDWKKNPSEG
jgi:NTP pyrophosphatase (non-canonical NTP hydrolase)